ncbi:hypothetical protein KFL_000250380 [Klebsormidium nitens]|uniref:Uncharacterized protein n=1 Tax=Klebsormidium nitens TaxID=105231 RepID=A0A1Y1HQ99_KLENI|nr:hypothetical protein KFL_000250380 [Klebsormidium nitens]|eukprot:GAQ79161.1 hypothetical protein KFL_000250380 [Klebsormidium nitens]
MAQQIGRKVYVVGSECTFWRELDEGRVNYWGTRVDAEGNLLFLETKEDDAFLQELKTDLERSNGKIYIACPGFAQPTGKILHYFTNNRLWPEGEEDDEESVCMVSLYATGFRVQPGDLNWTWDWAAVAGRQLEDFLEVLIEEMNGATDLVPSVLAYSMGTVTATACLAAAADLASEKEAVLRALGAGRMVYVAGVVGASKLFEVIERCALSESVVRIISLASTDDFFTFVAAELARFMGRKEFFTLHSVGFADNSGELADLLGRKWQAGHAFGAAFEAYDCAAIGKGHDYIRLARFGQVVAPILRGADSAAISLVLPRITKRRPCLTREQRVQVLAILAAQDLSGYGEGFRQIDEVGGSQERQWPGRWFFYHL